MDNESDKATEPMGEVPLGGLGKSELKRLVRGWQREARTWFQRQGEAYWQVRPVVILYSAVELLELAQDRDVLQKTRGQVAWPTSDRLERD